jgi:hypothetical protein
MTTSQQSIEIPLSKNKLTLMLLGSLTFVVLGILFVMNPETFRSPVMGNSTVIYVVGISAILFFSLCFLLMIKKLGDNSSGLIISDKGVMDNSGGVSAGQILWTDIESISVIEIHHQKLIMIHVKNPQRYIDRQTNTFKRGLAKLNLNTYGTPISISANGLKISFAELFKILTERLNES